MILSNIANEQSITTGQHVADHWLDLNAVPFDSNESDVRYPQTFEGRDKNSTHIHQRFMFWWIPASSAQRFRKLESIVAKPFLVVYYPVEDGVYPSGNLDVTWKANLNMIGNEVRVLFHDQEFYRSSVESELQQTSLNLEPGTHVISIQLVDRVCLLQSLEGCEILELSVAFSIVQASFAWQEHDQPLVVTRKGKFSTQSIPL
jgi:hypothetical protein